jgi:hypothetical protein
LALPTAQHLFLKVERPVDVTQTEQLDTPDDIQIDQDRPSRGWRRMREIRTSDEAETRTKAEGLINGLGRPATMADVILSNTIAALSVRADRLRVAGKARESENTVRLMVRSIALLRGRPGGPNPVNDPASDWSTYLKTSDEDENEDEDALA